MNALYIAALCAVLALSSAQEDASLLQCISGYSVNGVGNFTEQTCTSAENSCQSKIVRNGVILVIYKRCKEASACENNAKNSELCTGSTAYSNDVQICHSCCSTDFCNTIDNVPDISKPEEPEAGIEGRAFEGSA